MLLRGWSDREEALEGASIPQSFTEVPPEAVTEGGSCVEAGCMWWVLLGVGNTPLGWVLGWVPLGIGSPVLDLPVLRSSTLCENAEHPLFSVKEYKHQAGHFHIHCSHLCFETSYTELK